MIWRGPMVISAITQMLKDVAWGELDIMVVDMPPARRRAAHHGAAGAAGGCGDRLDAARPVADRRRRGLNMFKRVDVPVLGIIENMSYFLCPKCGERSDFFSHGGAKAEAEKLHVPFLGELPLHMSIREIFDAACRSWFPSRIRCMPGFISRWRRRSGAGLPAPPQTRPRLRS